MYKLGLAVLIFASFISSSAEVPASAHVVSVNDVASLLVKGWTKDCVDAYSRFLNSSSQSIATSYLPDEDDSPLNVVTRYRENALNDFNLAMARSKNIDECCAWISIAVARILRSAGRYEVAQQTLLPVFANKKLGLDTYSDAYIESGLIRLKSGDFEKARLYFEKVTEIDTTQREQLFVAQYWAAVCLMKSKRFAESIEGFRKLRKNVNASIDLRAAASLQLGWVFWNQSKVLQSAQAWYSVRQEFKQADPSLILAAASAESYYYLSAQDTDSAHETLTNALANAENVSAGTWAKAQQQLCEILRKSEKAEAAVKSASSTKHALRRQEGNASVARGLTLVRFLEGEREFAEASAILMELAEALPPDAQLFRAQLCARAVSCLAQCTTQMNAGKPGDAIVMIKSALQRTIWSKQDLIALTDALLVSIRKSLAQKPEEEVLNVFVTALVSVGNPALNGYSTLAQARQSFYSRKLDDALTRVQAALSGYDGHWRPELLCLGAMICVRRNQDERASEYINELCDKFPNEDAAGKGHYLRGCIHLLKNNKAAAVSEFQKVLSDYPYNSITIKTNALLAELYENSAPVKPPSIE